MKRTTGRELGASHDEAQVTCFQTYANVYHQGLQDALTSTSAARQICVEMRLEGPAPPGPIGQAWVAPPARIRVPDTFTAGDVMALACLQAKGAFIPTSVSHKAETDAGRAAESVLLGGTIRQVVAQGRMKRPGLGSERRPLELWVAVQPHGHGVLNESAGLLAPTQEQPDQQLGPDNLGLQPPAPLHLGGEEGAAAGGDKALKPAVSGASGDEAGANGEEVSFLGPAGSSDEEAGEAGPSAPLQKAPGAKRGAALAMDWRSDEGDAAADECKKPKRRGHGMVMDACEEASGEVVGVKAGAPGLKPEPRHGIVEVEELDPDAAGQVHVTVAASGGGKHGGHEMHDLAVQAARSRLEGRQRRKQFSTAEIHAILDGLLALQEEERETAWASIKRRAGAVLADRSNVNLKDKWRNLQLAWFRNELSPELAAKVARAKAKADHRGPWLIGAVW